MSDFKSKVSYVKGLADGLELQDSKEKKLMMEIISVLTEMGEALDELENAVQENQEYLESIDEDLGELEENYYGSDDDDDYDEDEDDFDEDELDFDDEDFIEVECPKCHETVYIDEDLVDEDGKAECPNCKVMIDVKQIENDME
ncbi:MAG TPA: hypothetical protein GXX35_07560 [Thermoanaerobacterales bacterium]|nr:hypothetical protein [Thermoanaerobacterales bacterium]